MSNLLNKIFIVCCLLTSPLAGADPLAVRNGVVFFLTGTQLQAYPLLPTGALPAGCPSSLAVTAATDIVISRNFAILAPGKNHAAFDSIDVSACLSESDDTKVDLKKGTLEILCAQVYDGNKIADYHVIMKQRGSSMNWEVTFAEPACLRQIP